MSPHLATTQRICIAAVLAGLRGLAIAGPAETHVLDDRVIERRRELSLVVALDGQCIPAAQIEVDPPFVGTVKTSCVVEIVGPPSEALSVHAAGERLPVLHAPVADAPPAPPRMASIGRAIDLVGITAPVPVAREIVAAHLYMEKDGVPTSDVSLNITVEGGRPRALRWSSPGVAEIALLVPEWRPFVVVVAQRAGDPPIRTTVAVDPGPPRDVVVDVPVIHAAVPFEVAARISTTAGVQIAAERVRVQLPRCTRLAPMTFSCAVPGPTDLGVSVELEGIWIPLDHREVIIPPVAAVAVAVPVAVPARMPRGALGWEVALRGGRASDGTWGGGASAFASYSLTRSITGLMGVGWRYQRATFAGMSPVDGRLALAEQELGLLVGARATPVPALPWTVRLVLGPAYVHQRAALGGISDPSAGLRAVGIVTTGVHVHLDRYTIGVDVGAHVAVDLVVPGWSRPAAELVAEVGVAAAL